jgi:alkylated DNA repair dioxygenase AlkB
VEDSEFVWQPSLLAVEGSIEIDHTFSGVKRIHLDKESWVDFAPGWVSGADRLLTAPWSARSGETLEPAVLEEIRRVLSERYNRALDSVGFNLYRDGRDSVAWHADRIKKEIEDPIVALVSLGEPRKFLLRPKGGGKSRAFMLGRGDLLVTGGKSQRTWEHSVPKVAQAGPRISLAYRHGMDESAYAGKRVEDP